MKKYGVYLNNGFDIDIREKVKIIADVGFSYTSFFYGDKYGKDNLTKDDIADIIRSNGLEIEYVHSDFSGANGLWLDDLYSDELIKRYVNTIEACGKFGIPNVVLHLSGSPTPPAFNFKGLTRIRKLLDLCEDKNVNLALENLRFVDYNKYIYDNLVSPKLKFCYDSGHENCFSKQEIFKYFADKLSVVHLHDNNGLVDEHRLPHDGTVNWQKIKENLKDYNGVTNFEVTLNNNQCYNDWTQSQFLQILLIRAKGIFEV